MEKRLPLESLPCLLQTHDALEEAIRLAFEHNNDDNGDNNDNTVSPLSQRHFFNAELFHHERVLWSKKNFSLAMGSMLGSSLSPIDCNHDNVEVTDVQ